MFESETLWISKAPETLWISWVQGWNYLWCQRFSACFASKINTTEGRWGEKGGSANFKTKYTAVNLWNHNNSTPVQWVSGNCNINTGWDMWSEKRFCLTFFCMFSTPYCVCSAVQLTIGTSYFNVNETLSPTTRTTLYCCDPSFWFQHHWH